MMTMTELFGHSTLRGYSNHKALSILLLLSLVILLLYSPSNGIVPEARALTVDQTSTVFVHPITSCCIAPGSSYNPLTVVVMMNLTAGEIINGFDVSLNYSTPSSGPFSVLNPVGLDATQSVLNSTYPGQAYSLALCINDITYGNNGFCTAEDGPIGRVHVQQTLVGHIISGPQINAPLFTTTFNVTGLGSSVFTFHTAILLNPGAPSGPPNPHPVTVVTQAGVFGNNGLVAFFNSIPPVPPSILPGQTVGFDASGSFISTASGPAAITSPQYSWDFGDGTNVVSSTQPKVPHVYLVPGNYTVHLAISNTTRTGYVQEVVYVLPALGGLLLNVRNLAGSPIGGVQVRLQNSTAPLACAKGCNLTSDGDGAAQFRGLAPGSYLVSFSGPTLIDHSEMVNVNAGWTTSQYIYLTPVPTPTDQLPLTEIIFIGALVGAVVAFSLGMFWRRRKMRRDRAESAVVKGKAGKKQAR